MVKTLLGLDFAFPYLDNIFIYSKGKKEHHHHLTKVCIHLQQAGFTAIKAKGEIIYNIFLEYH